MSAYGTKVVAIIEPQSDVGQKLSSLFTDVQSLKNQMTTLLADAPETLDTLNEIAAAISDDPAFFTTMSTANTTLQNNIDALSTAAATARTALQTLLQAAIDANKLTSDNAESALSGRLDSLEADPTTATALAAVSGRVTTLEADPTTKTYVDTTIANLVDSAPGVLDTLNELAAAIGDDENFATTINNNIAAVQADVDQNETDADTAIAALQADVDQNESDADAADAALSARITTLEADPTTATAVAAVQADVDQNEADADAAIAAVQADVDQNEADADAALATKLDLAGGTLTGSLVIHRQFPDCELKSNEEKRLLFTDAGGGATGAIKNVDSDLDFFAGGVTASDKVMTVASDGVDVSALKIDGTSVTSTAAELNQLDGITLGTAAQSASGDFATAAQGAKADSALQAHQDISGKADLSGATFTGNVEVSKNWPDITLKSGDEKRFLFSDAGGGATGAIKHVSTSLDFYASGIAAGNKEFSVTASGIEVTNGVTLLKGLSEYSNDSAAATGGIPVGGLYRTMQLVKIRVS